MVSQQNTVDEIEAPPPQPDEVIDENNQPNLVVGLEIGVYNQPNPVVDVNVLLNQVKADEPVENLVVGGLPVNQIFPIIVSDVIIVSDRSGTHEDCRDPITNAVRHCFRTTHHIPQKSLMITVYH